MAEWLKAADCKLNQIKIKFAVYVRNYIVKIRLSRGSLNRYADDNPELKSRILSVETLHLASYKR